MNGRTNERMNEEVNEWHGAGDTEIVVARERTTDRQLLGAADLPAAIGAWDAASKRGANIVNR